MSGKNPPCGAQDEDPPDSEVKKAIRNSLISLIYPVIFAVIILIVSAIEGVFLAGLEVALWIIALIWSINLSRLPFKIIEARNKALCEKDADNPACWAGIVTHVEESFSSGWHVLFPWAANHPYVDVVVKRDYTHLVTVGTYYIHCDSVVPYGYILRTYYYDESVCKVLGWLGDPELGGRLANISWAIGGLVGVAAAGAMVPFAAPLVFLLVTVLVAVLVFLILAAIVGGIIRATTDSTEPTADGTAAEDSSTRTSEQGRVIAEGDLLTVQGDVFTHPDLGGANVGWFGIQSLTSIHGRAVNTEPPYSNEDADYELPVDGCPTRNSHRE